MCIWPRGAAHRFASSCCFENKYSTFICFLSETRIPRGGLERWVSEELELPGQSRAGSKALPKLGRCRSSPSPPVRSLEGLIIPIVQFLHPPPQVLLSVMPLQSAHGVACSPHGWRGFWCCGGGQSSLPPLNTHSKPVKVSRPLRLLAEPTIRAPPSFFG